VKPVRTLRVLTRMTPNDRKRDAPDPQAIAEARARSRQIGKILHLAFDDVTREPVPSEFLELLDQLEERERKSPDRPS
jgi:hypothetical protein